MCSGKEPGDSLSVAILRPTEIFGSGGQGLREMLIRLEIGNPIINYLRSSISGKRRINLVPVKDVVRALAHLCLRSTHPGIYICSADDDPDNRYDRIEEIMKDAIGSRRRSMPIKLPPHILRSMLYLRRRGTGRFVDRIYLSDKLAETGSQRIRTIKDAVRDFVLVERTGE